MASSTVTNGFAAVIGLKSPSKRNRVQSRRTQQRGVRTTALGPDGRDQPWHDGHKNEHADGKADPLYFPPPRSPDDLSRRASQAASSFTDNIPNGEAVPSFPPNPASTHPENAQPAPVNRGVCWSNLQDLDDVPSDDAVYILVFGAGTGSEGLYSLQERTKDDVPVDIILAFPTHEDAARYGTLLEAEMGRVPVVEAARPEDLKYTCREGGYRCKVARRGVLLMPPEKTVEVTDWERTNALRQGQWSVQGFEEQLSSDMDAQIAGFDAGDKSPNVGVLSAADFKAQYEAVCGDVEDDEACVLPPDYDEEAARQQLMKMFNRGDWNPY